jgi:putative redox protein
MVIAGALVQSEHKYLQAIETGHHHLVGDEPLDNGGQNAGPSPYGLLLSALGSCTSATLRMYAERKGWELGTIRVRLALDRHEDKSEHITRQISFGAPLSDEQKRRLGEIAEKTPVTKTLRRGTPITTDIVGL